MSELNQILSSEDIEVGLSSRTIELGKYFTERDAKSQLLVLVEDKDDVAFWRLMFSCISSSYASIDVWTLQEAAKQNKTQLDAEGNPLSATGKDALMLVRNLGKNKVVAVDKDWDGLVPGHKYDKRLQNDPYVIHTSFYAIENHVCSAAAIPVYFRKITGEQLNVSFDDALAAYNDCLDPILLYLLAEDTNSIANSVPHIYSVNNLKQELKQLYTNPIVGSLKQCKVQLLCSHSVAIAQKQNEINQWKNMLNADKSYPDGLWKIVQGHTLFDFVERWLYEQVDIEFKRQMALAEPKQRTAINKSFCLTYESKSKRVRAIFYDDPYIDFNDKAIIKIQNKIKSIP